MSSGTFYATFALVVGVAAIGSAYLIDYIVQRHEKVVLCERRCDPYKSMIVDEGDMECYCRTEEGSWEGGNGQ